MKGILEKDPVLARVAKAEEVAWVNKRQNDAVDTEAAFHLSQRDIDEAEERLTRFAPFIAKAFPETAEKRGLIESRLAAVPRMQEALRKASGSPLSGALYLKLDSDLPIAGSVKARGGIYEVLKHAEEIALSEGLVKAGDSYEVLASDESRAFFSKYIIQVGSTGNLGLSIGIAGAAVGFRVIVHMSADAKQWKKDLLRSKGVTVVEYASDYSGAVAKGRALSDADPMSYFIDDENSVDLFMGYAVAASRLVAQLEAESVTVDKEHPLFVYLPCGVGGAPGGVTFGLKKAFGTNVHCFFTEPTESPCMLLGMASGLQSAVCVQDIGLSGLTHADGLAVGRPSGFVGGVMDDLLSGVFTVADPLLYDYMRMLLSTEDLFIEPSACAAFIGPVHLEQMAETKAYIEEKGLLPYMENATHIAWATGGRLVPEEIREDYQNTYL